MNGRPREGELYRVLCVFGREFRLYYGYYDERERQSRYSEPIPIYPDFRASPQHTEQGQPFVTAMQDACEHFSGERREDGCHGCEHYCHGEEFIGLCKHKARQQNTHSNMEETNE